MESMESSCCHSTLSNVIKRKDDFLTSQQENIKFILGLVIVLLYGSYYAYALYHDFSNNPALLILTSIGLVLLIVYTLKISCLHKCDCKLPGIARVRTILGWLVPVCLLIGISIFMIVDARHNPRRLVSGAGLVAILFTAVIISANPSKIQWHCVMNGLCVQLVLGLIVLRWPAGYSAFRWLGEQVAQFLTYSDVGAEFVFGEKFREHSTAMQSMPVAIYFGAVSSILYYLGVLQVVIRFAGQAIQVTMGTGAIESFVAASNIFLGPTEAVLTVAPFLSKMTKAELHSVLSCGFSTISGSVLAIYISFGVSPSHLVTASVMSAPAALAVSRILLPESDVSKVALANEIVFEKREDRNLVEAASRGASGCVRIVGYILSNMIAFTAGIQFLNMTLSWFGDRAGIAGLTFQKVCGWILWPLAFLLGVDAADCGKVGQLIASAIVLNSFFSFIELGQLIKNRQSGLQPALSPRSEAIVTYAVCNFANFGSIGMNLGTLGAMAPDRRADLANVALRALVAGNMASFMTACISGLLFDG